MKNSASFLDTVDRFIDEASPSSMDALIRHVRSESIADSDIAYLAQSCAIADGLIWDQMDDAADVASTGGPTSLTTLLCPLYLRAFGHRVPKLGVPGRPAGGIDVLAQIPGFKFRLTSSEAADVLKTAGYVHFLAGKQQAHHDALLFAYRKKVNALNVPPLVIASLLTKKLVAGLSRVGLDVRVSSFANFGTTWHEAKDNAKRFCDVARILGISAVCFLTDASIPYQPYIGRGESLVALAHIFEGTGSPELNNHLNLCYAVARGTSEFDVTRPTLSQVMDHFEENLVAQGASIHGFFEKVKSVVDKHQFALTASEGGFLAVDVEALRRVLVRSQNDLVSEANSFPDPVGVILKGTHGAYFNKGDVTATVRADTSVWPRLRTELAKALTICQTPMRSRYFEEVKSV